jgi:hypothetical protein
MSVYNPKRKPHAVPQLLQAVLVAVLLISLIGGFLYYLPGNGDESDLFVSPKSASRITVDNSAEQGSSFSETNLSDLVIPADEFETWKPFANHHSSKPINVTVCDCHF